MKDAGELERDPRGGELAGRGARGGAARAGSPGAPSATWRSSSSARCARRGAGAVVPVDRGRRRRTARCRTPSRASDTIARGRARHVDWGARLDGYCSDCTRTFATGELDRRGDARSTSWCATRRQRALDAVRGGRGGQGGRRRVARRSIEAAGHGEHFGHGLGHGVGLEVHEAPRLAPTSEDTLAAGNVVTVEPGVYVPGQLRRADRGPGRGHRRRPRGAERAAARSSLSRRLTVTSRRPCSRRSAVAGALDVTRRSMRTIVKVSPVVCRDSLRPRSRPASSRVDAAPGRARRPSRARAALGSAWCRSTA